MVYFSQGHRFEPLYVPRYPKVDELRQPCRLLRVEMKQYFYIHHPVVFDTSQGLDLWVKKRSDELIWMRDVRIVGKAYSSFSKSTLQNFKNLRHFTSQLPKDRTNPYSSRKLQIDGAEWKDLLH